MTVTRFYLKFSLCLTSIFMLTACAVTDAQVRANPGETGSFSVQLPLKDTVENFTDRAKQCYVYGDQYANLIVNEITPDHYYNIELAQWVYATQILLTVDFKRDGDDTDVVYYRKSGYTGKLSGGLLGISNIKSRMISFSNNTGPYCGLFN